jgi:hypothetical protein
MVDGRIIPPLGGRPIFDRHVTTSSVLVTSANIASMMPIVELCS